MAVRMGSDARWPSFSLLAIPVIALWISGGIIENLRYDGKDRRNSD
jgi:hypothetical protein